MLAYLIGQILNTILKALPGAIGHRVSALRFPEDLPNLQKIINGA